MNNLLAKNRLELNYDIMNINFFITEVHFSFLHHSEEKSSVYIESEELFHK